MTFKPTIAMNSFTLWEGSSYVGTVTLSCDVTKEQAARSIALISSADDMLLALADISEAGESGPLSCTDIYAIKQRARTTLHKAQGGK